MFQQSNRLIIEGITKSWVLGSIKNLFFIGFDYGVTLRLIISVE